MQTPERPRRAALAPVLVQPVEALRQQVAIDAADLRATQPAGQLGPKLRVPLDPAFDTLRRIGVVLQDLDDRGNRAGNRQQSQPPVPTTRLGAHRVLLRFLPRRLMSAVGWYNRSDAGR